LPIVAAKRPPRFYPIYSEIFEVSSPSKIAIGITAIEYIIVFIKLEEVFININTIDIITKTYNFFIICTHLKLISPCHFMFS
jgi:hypothetical protein